MEQVIENERKKRECNDPVKKGKSVLDESAMDDG